MTHPKIQFEGKDYYQIGCRRCGKGRDWNIYSDGIKFVAKCSCGNIVVMDDKALQNNPDKKIISMRMIV